MDIENRIREIRYDNNLNQSEFAERIGIGQAGLSAIEKGVRNVTYRNIQLICEKFNINENWLRNGIGAKEIKLPEEDEVAKYVADLLLDEDDQIASIIKGFIVTYEKLDKNSKQVLKEFGQSLLNNIKKE